MSDDKSTSLINLGELSKPANTLIKKVSSAVGGVFEPWQIKRVAKAEAEANLINAKAEIEITDLHRRAMSRFVEEEATKQENMEQITKKSLPHLSEESDVPPKKRTVKLRGMLRFKLRRAHITKIRVATLPIVEHLDVFKQALLGFAMCSVIFMINQLGFQCAEKTFCHRVI